MEGGISKRKNRVVKGYEREKKKMVDDKSRRWNLNGTDIEGDNQ